MCTGVRGRSAHEPGNEAMTNVRTAVKMHNSISTIIPARKRSLNHMNLTELDPHPPVHLRKARMKPQINPRSRPETGKGTSGWAIARWVAQYMAQHTRKRGIWLYEVHMPPLRQPPEKSQTSILKALNRVTSFIVLASRRSVGTDPLSLILKNPAP